MEIAGSPRHRVPRRITQWSHVKKGNYVWVIQLSLKLHLSHETPLYAVLRLRQEGLDDAKPVVTESSSRSNNCKSPASEFVTQFKPFHLYSWALLCAFQRPSELPHVG